MVEVDEIAEDCTFLGGGLDKRNIHGSDVCLIAQTPKLQTEYSKESTQKVS